MTLTTSADVPTPVVTINSAIDATDDSATITGTVDPIGYRSTDGVLLSKDQSELFIYPQANPRTYYAMPDGVVFIEDGAFLNCSNLTGITLGNHVAKIANWAFFGCASLARISIPDSVTNIESAPYANSGQDQ